MELLSERVNSLLIYISPCYKVICISPYKEDCTASWSDDTTIGYEQGDRVDMLLDLDTARSASLRTVCGIGTGEGMAGPVHVHAVQLGGRSRCVRLLPNTEAPADV